MKNEVLYVHFKTAGFSYPNPSITGICLSFEMGKLYWSSTHPKNVLALIIARSILSKLERITTMSFLLCPQKTGGRVGTQKKANHEWNGKIAKTKKRCGRRYAREDMVTERTI